MSRELVTLCQALLRPRRLRELRAARRRERWDDGEMAAYRAERLGALLTHAAAAVPFYRERLAGSGVVAAENAFAVLADLPLIDKLMLIETPDAFRAGHLAGRRFPSRTGGSTGTMLHFDLDRAANAARFAADMRAREWAGWRSGETVAMLWGHHADLRVVGALGARLRNALLHRLLMLDATNLSEQRVAGYLAAIREQRATLLIGYASALHFLAGTMLAQGLRNPGVRGVVSTAETLGEEERTLVEQAFGCPILNRYGSREMGVVAQQCGRGTGLHVSADCVHLEVVAADGRPCAPGEIGEIVLTDLHNHVMPFLRYRTGDLAVLAETRCACGRTLPVLTSVAGRTSDVLVGRDGQVFSCPGPVFWTEGVPGVRQLQLYQPDRETIEARVVPGPAWNDEASARLAARLRELLGDVRVDLVLREEIPVTASGKYRFAISDVSPFRAGVSRP